MFSWDISPQWRIETDPNLTSEVEVRFFTETPERTRLELEHRNIDRHGPGWQAVTAAVDSDEGMAAVPGPLREPVHGGHLNVADHYHHRDRPPSNGRLRLRHRPDPVQRVAEGRESSTATWTGPTPPRWETDA